MKPDADRIARIADRVARRAFVDWRAEERAATDPETRKALRGLKLLATLADSQQDDSAVVTREGTLETASVDRWGPLDLLEKLGEGSFAEVYRARDPRLQRDVALKLIKRPVTDDDRVVIEEARQLARVRHPNVVTVHGAERHDECEGIWMELVSGRTLAEIVRSDGPMGAHEASLVGATVCKALAAVHGAGILHRDVKADNVLREEGGRIVLTDFGTGLDRAVGSDPPSISGTPLYMAPEALAGDPITEQSDLYSVGVLLFHLVSGEFPHKAPSLGELRQALASGSGRQLRDVRPGLPERFLAVVERALASDPDDRFESAGEMERALVESLRPERGDASRTWWRVGIPSLLLLAILAVVTVTTTRQQSVPVETAGERLLVLPFEVRGGGAGESGYLGVALAESVAIGLAQAREIRTAPVPPSAPEADPIEAARAQGARYLAHGSVERRGTALDARVQLIDVASGDLLGGVTASGTDSQLAAISSTLLQGIVEELGVTFNEVYDFVKYGQSRSPISDSQELAEVEAALRSLDNRRQLETTERLTARFPEEPGAWVTRVNVYTRVIEDDPSPESQQGMERAIERLLALDARSPNVAIGRASLAYARGDTARALDLYSQLISRDDLSTRLRGWIVRLRSQRYAELGRDDLAVEDGREAIRLDPANVWGYASMSFVLSKLGQSEESLTMALRAVALRPESAVTNRCEASALAQLGRWPEAAIAARRATHGAGAAQDDHGLLALALRRSGDASGAADAAATAENRPDTPGGTVFLARDAALAGNADHAIDLLRRAIDAGLTDRRALEADEFEPLGGDRRFRPLLEGLQSTG
jgi:serine/threonine-protein kinase